MSTTIKSLAIALIVILGITIAGAVYYIWSESQLCGQAGVWPNTGFISENEFVSIMEYDEIDKTGDDEVDGINWLDTVEHMLEFYGESRTDSCSGLVLAAHDQ